MSEEQASDDALIPPADVFDGIGDEDFLAYEQWLDEQADED